MLVRGKTGFMYRKEALKHITEFTVMVGVGFWLNAISGIWAINSW